MEEGRKTMQDKRVNHILIEITGAIKGLKRWKSVGRVYKITAEMLRNLGNHHRYEEVSSF